MSTSPLPPSADPTSPLHYPPSQTLLLLLDFHSLVINIIPTAGSAAATQAIALKQWAISQNIRVAHALVDPKLPIPPTAKDPKRLQSFIDMFEANPEKWAEPDGIKSSTPGNEEHLFLRAPGYVSAQKSKGFEEFMREHGIKSLILAGLSTSGCVLRTAMVAAEDEYIVTIMADACADRKEEVHEVVKGVLEGKCWVVGLEELKKGWVPRGE